MKIFNISLLIILIISFLYTFINFILTYKFVNKLPQLTKVNYLNVYHI